MRMSEENNKSQNQEQPRRFNQAQYDLLKRCSEKKDMTEWDDWRNENLSESIESYIEIELEGANLTNEYLRGAQFYQAL
jgi:hypothetical protein